MSEFNEIIPKLSDISMKRLTNPPIQETGKNALNPGDVTTLYHLYNTENPPPIALIRLPQVLITEISINDASYDRFLGELFSDTW